MKSAVEGTDKLISIDAAWFEGSQELKTLAELSAPAAMTNTANDQYGHDQYGQGGHGECRGNHN